MTISTILNLFKSTSTSRDTVFSATVGVGRLKNQSNLVLSVETGVSAFVVELGSVSTANVLMITSDEDITYTVNGGADDIPLTGGGVVLHMGTEITALTIGNASGSEATVQVMAFGPQED